MVVVIARDAIHEAKTLGGPMATGVREARYRFLRLQKRSVLSPADEFELTDQLTLGRTAAGSGSTCPSSLSALASGSIGSPINTAEKERAHPMTSV
jgi:hypothetical protein